jgi:hypothetical protein
VPSVTSHVDETQAHCDQTEIAGDDTSVLTDGPIDGDTGAATPQNELSH